MVLAGVATVIAIGMATGCGAADSKVLSAAETKHLLRSLPYEYSFRFVPLPEGATGAVAGKVTGAHRTTFQFGIALGHEPDPVPVPGIGSADAVGVPIAGFTFTTNLVIKGPSGQFHPPPSIQTAAQSNESSRMEVAMEEALCKAATGKPCPV